METAIGIMLAVVLYIPVGWAIYRVIRE